MTYPPVIQLETRAHEAEAQARLARERRAARGPKRTTDSWRRLMKWLPLTGREHERPERARFL